MPKRIERVNELIKREVSQILVQEIEFPANTLVTVTRAETFPNLIEVRVFISVIPEQSSGKILAILNRQIFRIQQKINRRLRMRPIPKIVFEAEKTTGEADKIEKLLEKISKN